MSSSLGGDVTELFTGANTAPTPQVTSRPPAEVLPEQWTAPKVSNAGQLTVQHEDLHAAASVIKTHLAEIDNAIATIQQFYGSFDCLQAWPAGQQMCQNLMDLATTFESVLKKTSGAHADTAAKLTATADAYKNTEDTATHAARQVAARTGSAKNALSTLLNGDASASPPPSSGGTAPPSGGNLKSLLNQGWNGS